MVTDLIGGTSPLETARRIVVKIGSSLLVEERTGRIHRAWLRSFAEGVADLRSRGCEIVIVSSGAIAVGRRHLGLDADVLKLEDKQAAAATGQIRLAHAYEETLARHGVTVAQILLSPDDTERRRRHLNARATILTLLNLGAIPIINENDSVSTDEIRFGDNDPPERAGRADDQRRRPVAAVWTLMACTIGIRVAMPTHSIFRLLTGSRRKSSRWPGRPEPLTPPAAWSPSWPPVVSRPPPDVRWQSSPARVMNPLAVLGAGRPAVPGSHHH